MPLHSQVEAYLKQLAGMRIPPLEQLTPEEARRNAEAGAAALFGPKEEVASVEDREFGGVPCRVYRAASARPREPTTVYFHGGGWVLGNLETHDGIGRALARRSGATVVAVDYRLAPEHRFPTAVEDAWAVLEALGAETDRLAVAGDSAGGNLAAVVALRARDSDLPLRLQVLVYPVTDYNLDSESYLANADGYGLTRSGMGWYWAHYLGDQDGRTPEASPLQAENLAGVAPALVLTCEYDPLRFEGQAYARRLREAGVRVQLTDYAGLIHGFWRMAAVIDGAQSALDEVAGALRAALA